MWEARLIARATAGVRPRPTCPCRHTSDLTETPGWRRAVLEVRAAIVDGAAPYLRQTVPDHREWLGLNRTYWPAWAGYCALKLLFTERRATFDELESELWHRWAPVVVGWRSADSEGGRVLA